MRLLPGAAPGPRLAPTGASARCRQPALRPRRRRSPAAPGSAPRPGHKTHAASPRSPRRHRHPRPGGCPGRGCPSPRDGGGASLRARGRRGRGGAGPATVNPPCSPAPLGAPLRRPRPPHSEGRGRRLPARRGAAAAAAHLAHSPPAAIFLPLSRDPPRGAGPAFLPDAVVTWGGPQLRLRPPTGGLGHVTGGSAKMAAIGEVGPRSAPGTRGWVVGGKGRGSSAGPGASPGRVPSDAGTSRRPRSPPRPVRRRSSVVASAGLRGAAAGGAGRWRAAREGRSEGRAQGGGGDREEREEAGAAARRGLAAVRERVRGKLPLPGQPGCRSRNGRKTLNPARNWVPCDA